MSRMRFRTLLFDVDGTLIDSNGAHAEAWTTAMREHGVEVSLDQIRRRIGMGGDKILPAIAHVREDSDHGQSITRRKKRIFNSLLPSLQPTRGARSLLEHLRRSSRTRSIARLSAQPLTATELGTRDPGLGARDSGSGTRGSGYGTRDSGSGTGTRDPGSGIRDSGFGTRPRLSSDPAVLAFSKV